jgi:cytosine/adenosine deaminase-related metal-dependent hydrolase
MESKAEKELLESGTGDFVSFFEKINVFEHPFPLDKTYWEMLNFPAAPLLSVHNTQLSAAEIAAMPVNSYFCLCPISNEYLHQQQPDARLFLPYADRVCMGTDSLASNPSLAMDKEIQAIAAQLGGDIEIGLHTALRWATTGGALALGINSRYGAFIAGQKPGINRLQTDGKWVRKLA